MNEDRYVTGPPQGRTCHTCRYAYKVGPGAGLALAQCRRHPPYGRLVEGLFVECWPSIPTAPDAGEPWCGEWHERDRRGWPWA